MERKVNFEVKLLLLAVSLIFITGQTGCAQLEPRALALYSQLTGNNYSSSESHFQFESALQFEVVEVEKIPLTTEQKTEVDESLKIQTNQITATFDGQTLPGYFSEAVQYWWCLGKIQYWADDAYQKYNVTVVTKSDFRLGLATVVQIESAGYPLAHSSSDARGLGQVMPFHFAAGADTYDPDTNLERASWHLSAEGVNRAAALGYSGLEALVQAGRGYNGGAGVIGKSSVAAETSRYEMYFRGFVIGNMEVVNLWFSNATPLTNAASAWLATQTACQK